MTTTKNYIEVKWHTIDVIERAKEHGIKVTKAQAMDILNLAHSNHDASIGINWEVLDFWTDHLLEKGDS